MEPRNVAILINQIIMGAVCAWAGYMIGKLRTWDEPYKLGHTHGYTMGLLDSTLNMAKLLAKKPTGNAGEAEGKL